MIIKKLNFIFIFTHQLFVTHRKSEVVFRLLKTQDSKLYRIQELNKTKSYP